MRFRYRLKGLEEQWVETRAGSARYPALRPGGYQFQVMVRSAAGVWSEAPATLDFEVQGPWWRSWWFLALGLALRRPSTDGRLAFGPWLAIGAFSAGMIREAHLWPALS